MNADSSHPTLTPAWTSTRTPGEASAFMTTSAHSPSSRSQSSVWTPGPVRETSRKPPGGCQAVAPGPRGRRLGGLIPISPAQVAGLIDWLGPERPGPLVAQHVAVTGHGWCRVDRLPEPRVAIAATADNMTVAGDPAALPAASAHSLLAGFVDAQSAFAPVLRAAFPDMVVWDRLVYELPAPPRPAPSDAAGVRRLGPGDVAHLEGLSDECAWISKTWGGPAGLAASGAAWGALPDGRLASVACGFFRGRRYEDLGVVTEPACRGRGLAAACAAALCADVIARGRAPSWTTSPDNVASVRVAERLGFALRRRDVLYLIGIPVPVSPPS